MTPPSTAVLPALTGLRFCLAMLVVIYHFAREPLQGIHPLLGNVASNGFAAVSGFFLLSGFVLAHRYCDSDLLLRGTLREFFAARFARIYPVYALSLILVLRPFFEYHFQGGFTPDRIQSAISGFVASVFLMQAWIPGLALLLNSAAWSLSVEAFLYLIFPAVLGHAGIVIARRPVSSAVLCWLAAFVVPVLHLMAAFGVFGPAAAHAAVGEAGVAFVSYNPVFHVPAFVLGIALRQLARERRFQDFATLRRLGWAGLVSLLVLLLCDWKMLFTVLNNAMLLGPFALLILSLAAGAAPLSKFLSTRPLLRLGEASYSLYILHMPLWAYLISLDETTLGLGKDSAGFLVIAFASVIVISLFIFETVEKPYRRHFRALLSATKSRAVAA